MLSPLKAARRRAIVLSGAALVAGGLFAGCDLQEDADVDRGRQLFQENCASCHTLAEAATNSPVGPDLDAAFVSAREAGMDEDTIEGVVQGQIANPREEASDDPAYMPAGIVTGQDAEDVATYVAGVAGVPGIAPPEGGTAQELFQELCGTCHTLEAAGTTPEVGPNLDDALPGQAAEDIIESIRDPQAQISETPFQGTAMSPFDANQIPDPNLNALVQYLLACTEDAGGDACMEAAEQTEADSPEPAGG